MKRLKSLLAMLLIITLIATMTSCFVISGQKMRSLKGTYKLTNYTYTPAHQRREGYTPTTHDYVNDDKYKYEDYLIITGTGMGYYVHKDASGDAYVKEITLAYEYDEEGKGKVEYVTYNDAVSVNSDESGTHRLGVNKSILNYSKSSFDYTEIITKRPMRTESLSVRWEKVDRATDLSYVKEQIDGFKEYDYKSFGMRGIYELTSLVKGEELAENPYQYFYYVIDTANGAATATAYYALKETPATRVEKSASISKNADDWSTFTLGGSLWSPKPMYSDTYVTVADGTEYTYSRASYSVTITALEDLIASSMPENSENG